MAYTKVNYCDFQPYKVECVAEKKIKKIVWDKSVSQKEIDSFFPHLTDARTKVLIQTTTCMPFDVYLIPRYDSWAWWEYVRSQKNLSSIFNCVYLLFGHDFIYAGKSVNGDRILGHVEDDDKDGFEYQMIFVPNNENAFTMSNWTSEFMAYLETLMIERLQKESNPYCQNRINGKSHEKCQRDLNLNEDKEAFATNVVELIFAAFEDLTCCSYLIPDLVPENFELSEVDNTQAEDEDSNGMLSFWQQIIRLSADDSHFHQLVKPRARKVVHRNMHADKKISHASICCLLTQTTCRVELAGWGDRNSAQANLRVYDTLYQHKEDIESEMGCQLLWDRKEGKYTTNISVSKSLSYQDTSNGTMRDIADFFTEYFDKFYTILPKYCVFEEDEDLIE